MATATKTAPPPINAAYVLSYVKLRARKSYYEKLARNCGKLSGVMEAEMLAKLLEETSEKDAVRKLKIGGWELELEEKPKRVEWAKEFVKRCGAAVAQQITNAVGKAKKVAVRAATTATLRQEKEAQVEALAEVTVKPAA